MPEADIYADVLLPIARGVFSYRVAGGIRGRVAEGVCVEARLGANKIYTGVIWRLYGDKPPYGNIRTIDTVIENSPVVPPLQMRFWEWLAGYYMCETGEVMQAALPSALKPKGFSHEEFAKDSYRPRVSRLVKLHGSIKDEQALNEKCESLRKAPKQYEAFVEFLSAAEGARLFEVEVPRELLKASAAILRKLEEKGTLSIVEREYAAGELPPLATVLPSLTPIQRNAYENITENFAAKDVVLLHGVTGSGKTEIYTCLINEYLKAGKDVLYLMPEISMTTQMVERIKGFFGERVVPYHSSFARRARVENYMRANRSRGGELIVGARSAVFLPANNLGLIIIDEEHDASYKNSDTAPRYHARDAAIVLARMAGAKVVLGSATPAIESYANALGGKYGLVTLDERYGGAPLPEMIVSDTLRAVKRGERTVHFNKILLDHIAKALAEGEQVMLFQNRRGFSPYVSCGGCGWVAMCPRCNVALTLHRTDNALRCHYCGYRTRPPAICPSCKAGGIEPRGFGTEKVEEELAGIFPEARIARLDRDTARSMRSYQSIISDFEKGEMDILVGTQMITKGLDFGGVSLVGILNADNLLFYPDFRASERAFQIMMQMAGRAGRRSKRGAVVIQTSQPDNPTIVQVAAGDYEAMAAAQLAERRDFFYPPYCRLISILLGHRSKPLLDEAAAALREALSPVFGRRLTGPQPPSVDRINDEHLLAFLLKVEKGASFDSAKKALAEAIRSVGRHPQFRRVKITCNVDPQ